MMLVAQGYRLNWERSGLPCPFHPELIVSVILHGPDVPFVVLLPECLRHQLHQIGHLPAIHGVVAAKCAVALRYLRAG